MPHELHVIRAGDFIRAGGSGRIDYDKSREVLRSLAAAMVSRKIDKAILDIRKMYGEPPATFAQLYHLATAFKEAGFGPTQRLAVLVSPDRTDKAEFFAICASGRGWNAWAFDEFEHAFDWLTDDVPIEPPTNA